jgi:hypothetical protein
MGLRAASRLGDQQGGCRMTLHFLCWVIVLELVFVLDVVNDLDTCQKVG